MTTLAIDLADLFARHKRVFLAFSGGKDSIALAHLCEPWRDRISLLWVNTSYMAPHMVDFVRAYGERFHLVELASPNLIEHWEANGAPVEILPIANLMGEREPKLQSWLACCNAIRQSPLNAFMAEQPAGSVLLNGQRRADTKIPEQVAEALRGQMPHVEIVYPLWDWSEADVMGYVENHSLELPSQYAEIADSLECLICPAPMKAERMRYLRRHFPDVAPVVESTVRESLAATAAAFNDLASTLAPEPMEDRAA